MQILWWPFIRARLSSTELLSSERMNYFPEEVLEHVFDFLTSHRDRNAVSLVCKSWFMVERSSRRSVFIGNCYAVSPDRLIARFPRVRSLTLKGKPHFADFNLVPHDWGGYVYPWIEAMVKSYSELEELRLKRMIVSDESLELLSRSFVNFKSLVLVSCEGFTTDGLAALASNCRYKLVLLLLVLLLLLYSFFYLETTITVTLYFVIYH